MDRRLAVTLAVASAALAGEAGAQSLESIMVAAREHDASLGVARAEVAVRAAEVSLARSALLPSLSLATGYTRNQVESVVSIDGGAPIVIVPYDQLDASATLALPLFDLPARRAIRSAEAARAATAIALEVAHAETDLAVVRAYHGWVGGAALVASSEVAERSARENLAVVERRAAADLASNLDVNRARAAVAEAEQIRAVAELAVATARRELESLSGLRLGADPPALTDEPPDVGPLEDWLVGLEGTPAVRAARAGLSEARARRAAVDAAMWPRIDAIAVERWSNAAGFGEQSSGSVGVTASWRFDASLVHRGRVARATERATLARERQARQAARDRAVDAWNTVVARRATVAATRARLGAAREGAAAATTRFGAGTATQLEVVEAQRDAFAADVALIQARAELALAGAVLRIVAGRPVTS